MAKYGVFETISNGFSLIISKILYPGARLIRQPFYCRGKRGFKFGKGLTTGYRCRIDLPGDKETLIIGHNCNLGDNVHIVAYEKVIIGNNCLMASKIFISDTSHGIYDTSDNCSKPNIPPNKRSLSTKPVTIGNNVWIGENVCILKGVTIGDGSIISANSVVTRNIPKNVIAAGIPSRVVKVWNSNKQIWENNDTVTLN